MPKSTKKKESAPPVSDFSQSTTGQIEPPKHMQGLIDDRIIRNKVKKMLIDVLDYHNLAYGQHEKVVESCIIRHVTNHLLFLKTVV